MEKSSPKYLAIAQQMIHAIRQGELQAGDRIPSENEIILAHDVSNTTARKALAYLANQGWIKREKGRGSFVSPRCVDVSLDRILDFNTSVSLSGGKPTARLLSVQLAEETPLMKIAARTYALEGMVCRIERLCLVNDVPMMLERRYVSATLCPGIEQHDLAGPLYELYEDEYELMLSEVHQDLSVVRLDSQPTMSLFELNEPVHAIRVQGATILADGRLVELEDAFYRSDRYRFTVVAHR
jgi:GntR family transcriptional regulator